MGVKMRELKIKIPKELEERIKELPTDVSQFVIEAIEERLAEKRLKHSTSFRKLLLQVFERMTEESRLSDKDCLRLGREVNEKVAKRYGLIE